jgi:glycosyltransferase involved in cell wall biosynthesis
VPRALLLGPSSVAGGAERALASLAQQLPTVGWERSVVLLGEGPLLDWLEADRCPVDVVPAGRLREVHRVVAATAQITRTIRQRGADVVVSSLAKGHLYGGTAAALVRVPAVYWQHMIPDATPIERAAAVVPAAATVVGSRRAATAQALLTPLRRIERIPPGVAVEGIAARAGERARIRQDLQLGAAPLVGVVGRLQAGKGQDVFLRAAAQIGRQREDVHFLVVGGAVLGWEGTYPDDLRRGADQHQELRGRVHFVGHQADVYPWYAALDVVVLASTAPESFGLVLVEAMALGRPVVATMTGGPTDIVEDGLSGLLVPPGDVDAMARAICTILNDPRRSTALAEGAEQRARRFSTGAMATAWGDLLDDVVPRNRRWSPQG